MVKSWLLGSVACLSVVRGGVRTFAGSADRLRTNSKAVLKALRTEV